MQKLTAEPTVKHIRTSQGPNSQAHSGNTWWRSISETHIVCKMWACDKKARDRLGTVYFLGGIQRRENSRNRQRLTWSGELRKVHVPIILGFVADDFKLDSSDTSDYVQRLVQMNIWKIKARLGNLKREMKFNRAGKGNSWISATFAERSKKDETVSRIKSRV